LNQLGPEYEVILVDDGSDDQSCELIRTESSQLALFRLPTRSGPSSARNVGAENASGGILLFLDSDVLVAPATIVAMVDFLEARPELTAVFGCYSPPQGDDECRLSRFRNLLHRLFHSHHGTGKAESFWSKIGAVRARAFREVGGFRPELLAIEDVELGHRLVLAQHQIHLNLDIHGLHLKRWTWRSMVKTDIWMRAAPWTSLGLQGRVSLRGLNLSTRFKAGPLLLAAVLILAFFSIPATMICALGYLLANLPVYTYMLGHGGKRMALYAIPYLAVHHLCCLLGSLIGGKQYLAHRRSKREPAVREGIPQR
jgi:glycosyltransferase involved in cell wall biosynthesis